MVGIAEQWTAVFMAGLNGAPPVTAAATVTQYERVAVGTSAPAGHTFGQGTICDG